jgi:hypothetical protein
MVEQLIRLVPSLNVTANVFVSTSVLENSSTEILKTQIEWAFFNECKAILCLQLIVTWDQVFEPVSAWNGEKAIDKQRFIFVF